MQFAKLLLSPGGRAGITFDPSLHAMPSDEATATGGGTAALSSSSTLSENTLTLRAITPTDVVPEKHVNVGNDASKPQSKAPSRDASKPASRSTSFHPEFTYDPNVPQARHT